MVIWKKDTPSDLLEYYYEDTKRVSLIVTNGERDDLTGDEIHKIMLNKLFLRGSDRYENRI